MTGQNNRTARSTRIYQRMEPTAAFLARLEGSNLREYKV